MEGGHHPEQEKKMGSGSALIGFAVNAKPIYQMLETANASGMVPRLVLRTPIAAVLLVLIKDQIDVMLAPSMMVGGGNHPFKRLGVMHADIFVPSTKDAEDTIPLIDLYHEVLKPLTVDPVKYLRKIADYSHECPFCGVKNDEAGGYHPEHAKRFGIEMQHKALPDGSFLTPHQMQPFIQSLFQAADQASILGKIKPGIGKAKTGKISINPSFKFFGMDIAKEVHDVTAEMLAKSIDAHLVGLSKAAPVPGKKIGISALYQINPYATALYEAPPKPKAKPKVPVDVPEVKLEGATAQRITKDPPF